MSDKTRKLLAWLLVVVAIVVAGFLGVTYPIPEPPNIQVMGDGDSHFTNLVASGDITAGDDLVVTDDSTLGGDIALTGNLAVGDGTPTVTQDGEDAYVEGQFEVDGEAQFDGAIDANSTVTIAGATTLASDLTVSPDATGGNQGAKNEINGLPRIKMVALSSMTNGSTETTSYMDDSPTGEYAPIDADVTEAEGSGDSVYRIGASSYKASFADTAEADDGFKRTITGDDLEDNESIGFWIYSDTALSAGDLQIMLTDDGGTRNYDIGAVASANVWTWVEVDISSLAGGTGDTVTEFGITLTSAGATNLGAFVIYVDGVWKWDADDEEDLGNAILQDGVLSVLSITTAQDQANTPAMLTENTDFFVHYESGNDYIVTVTDQSANSGVAMVAY